MSTKHQGGISENDGTNAIYLFFNDLTNNTQYQLQVGSVSLRYIVADKTTNSVQVEHVAFKSDIETAIGTAINNSY